MKNLVTREQERLFNENIEKIVGYFLSHNRSAIKYFDSVEDMFQELTCRVWTALHNYNKSKGAFTTYVFAICRNEVRKRYKLTHSKKRQGNVISLETELYEDYKLADCLPDDCNIDEKIEENMILTFVATRICSETYMYYIQGKTQQEIANELHIQRATVCRRIQKNIAEIREEIKEKEL